jgi:hypothetical protein
MSIDYTQFGRFAYPLLAGNLFAYYAPAAAFTVSATTGGHPTLINPSGSGKVFIPAAFVCSFVSGTTVIGSVLIAKTANCGQGAATGSPILTATLVAGGSAYVGGPGSSSVMQWSPTTNTFTAAPTVISATEINLGAADPTNSGHQHKHTFDGTLAVYPGNAISFTYSVTTSTGTYISTLYGMEISLPSSPLTPF